MNENITTLHLVPFVPILFFWIGVALIIVTSYILCLFPDCRAFVHALLDPNPQKRAKFSDLAKMEWLVHPTITAHSLLTSAPTMTSQYKSGETDDGCVPASSGASLGKFTSKRSKIVIFRNKKKPSV